MDDQRRQDHHRGGRRQALRRQGAAGQQRRRRARQDRLVRLQPEHGHPRHHHGPLRLRRRCAPPAVRPSGRARPKGSRSPSGQSYTSGAWVRLGSGQPHHRADQDQAHATPTAPRSRYRSPPARCPRAAGPIWHIIRRGAPDLHQTARPTPSGGSVPPPAPATSSSTTHRSRTERSPMSPISRRGFLTASAALGAAALGGGPDRLLVLLRTRHRPAPRAITHWDWYVSQEPWLKNEIALFEKSQPEDQDQAHGPGQRQVPGPDQPRLPRRRRPGLLPDPVQPAASPTRCPRAGCEPLDSLRHRAAGAAASRRAASSTASTWPTARSTAPRSPATRPWLQLYIHNGLFKQAGITNPDGSVKIPKTWDDVTARRRGHHRRRAAARRTASASATPRTPR